MFKKISPNSVSVSKASGNEKPIPTPSTAMLFKLIAEQSQADPLIGAKFGGKHMAENLIAAMSSPHGVHVASVLCALGGLAGYACQASVRAQAIARSLSETALLERVQATDGGFYYSGGNLNKPLAESPNSVWNLASGGALQTGCDALPDLGEIFSHSTASIGTPAFGRIRVPVANMPRDLPFNYVRPMWPVLKPAVTKFCPDPEHWPVLFGFSVQEVIVMGTPELDAGIATRIVMEAAVSMSMIDLKTS